MPQHARANVVPTGDETVTERIDSLLAEWPPSSTDPKAFWAEQFDRGLAWVDFPADLGGLALHRDAQREVDERLAAAGAPRNEPLNLIGLRMMAPLMVQFGRPDQRTRFLRAAFTCEEIWCQLFSEPNAGSDLASLSTRAERVGDCWVISGQKVWTTFAHVADWGLLLARTDPTVAKHKGLTYFIIDMSAPGVEVRPLRQITGEAEYNEVFLTEVRVPDTDRVADVGDGWKLAMHTLMAEREALAGLKGVIDGVIQSALNLWCGLPPYRRDPVRRDQLARLWTDAELFRVLVESGEQHGEPPEGPVVKILYGSLWQRIAEFCVGIRGMESLMVESYAMTQPDRFTSTYENDLTGGELAKSFLAAQALTIAGGTTNINKNIIAERLLGLPPEPRPVQTIPHESTETPRTKDTP